ncbi:uncharacterized protein IUM83_12710 [Phytophthora cinnamomi]|uniref:uncharacterized protein n=1 Tax=Phytophthora cinnamomi TaxID=4785 RepID=UPI003559A777|nr:hypothetical protein IUM83_12710 [Phytophthora cinnamomi]
MKQVRGAEKKGLCLDDGGAKKPKVDLRLVDCLVTSVGQTFVHDQATLLISQPNKAKLCVDDGTGFWFKATRLILKECDAYSKDQHFEFVLQTNPVTAATWTAILRR